MLKFNVTFETITIESAENGDVDSRGFVAENVSLREAIDVLGVGSEICEANEYPIESPRWVTMYRVNDDIGETENRSLHFPDSMTDASRLRVCRLLECYGV